MRWMTVPTTESWAQACTGEMTQHTAQIRLALNEFFLQVQGKALRQAQIATGDTDEAFDIVQHAMMKLTSRYSHQQDVWPPLFQRILQNTIRDWFRRQKMRRLLFWSSPQVAETLFVESEHSSNEPIDIAANTPERKMISRQQLSAIESALRELPPRQQQVFLLRAWWGHNTEETAFAMRCSTGSVKTHYSRALHKLKTLLEPSE